MKILNLTQHPATPEQTEAGVRDLDTNTREQLIALLTFDEIPDHNILDSRAFEIALLAHREFAREPFDAVMIGGAPFFMSWLEWEFEPNRFSPMVLYAFSKRESVEQRQPDNTIKKVSVFRHAGFVEAYRYR